MKYLLFALAASLPLLTQQEARTTQDAPPIPGRLQRAAFMEKFDADKDGQLSDEERKAARDARKAK